MKNKIKIDLYEEEIHEEFDVKLEAFEEFKEEPYYECNMGIYIDNIPAEIYINRIYLSQYRIEKLVEKHIKMLKGIEEAGYEIVSVSTINPNKNITTLKAILNNDNLFTCVEFEQKYIRGRQHTCILEVLARVLGLGEYVNGHFRFNQKK